MAHDTHKYIILFDDNNAILAQGKDPSDAVRSQFEALSMWCPPQEPIDSGQSTVTVFSLPSRIDDEVIVDLENSDGEEVAAALLKLRSKHHDITATTVIIAYSSDGVSVSEAMAPTGHVDGVPMTKDELSNKLHHLDPGANLTLEAADLAQIFGEEALTPEVLRAIEAFALEHRCSFVHDSAGGHAPTFDKDDVF